MNTCNILIDIVSKKKSKKTTKENLQKLTKDAFLLVQTQKTIDDTYSKQGVHFKAEFQKEALLGFNIVNDIDYFVFFKTKSDNPYKTTLSIVFKSEQSDISENIKNVKKDIKSVIKQKGIKIEKTYNELFFFVSNEKDIIFTDSSIRALITKHVISRSEKIRLFICSILILISLMLMIFFGITFLRDSNIKLTFINFFVDAIFSDTVNMTTICFSIFSSLITPLIWEILNLVFDTNSVMINDFGQWIKPKSDKEKKADEANETDKYDRPSNY